MPKITKQPADLTAATDEDLLVAYQRGVTEAFEILVRRYERELYNYLRRYLGDGMLAEDVFQLTCLQVHIKRDLYERGRAVRPWLYAIATNQAIDFLRRSGRGNVISLDVRPSFDSEHPTFADLLEGPYVDPLNEVEAAERRAWVRSAVARLPSYMRSVVELAYFHDKTQNEIADALNIPVGTVKSRTHASVRRLAEWWASEMQVQEEQSNHV